MSVYIGYLEIGQTVELYSNRWVIANRFVYDDSEIIELVDAENGDCVIHVSADTFVVEC